MCAYSALRWHGNADVAIMIEARGGSVLRPKFKRFNFTGNARIAFTPLVPHFPGFGAMTISLQSTPTVRLSPVKNVSVEMLCS